MEMKEKISEKGKHNLLKTVLHFLFLKLDRYSKKKKKKKLGKYVARSKWKKQQ